MYEKKSELFVLIAAYIFCFFAGIYTYTQFWGLSKRQGDLSVELERTRMELGIAREELSVAKTLLERLENGIDDSERLTDSARGNIGQAIEITGDMRVWTDQLGGA